MLPSRGGGSRLGGGDDDDAAAGGNGQIFSMFERVRPSYASAISIARNANDADTGGADCGGADGGGAAAARTSGERGGRHCGRAARARDCARRSRPRARP